MPIITSTDLNTNIYPEVVTEITRADNSITSGAINAAIQETKMYLSKFDLNQLFGTDETAPTVQDEFLNSLVKDLACWHLLRLANAGADYLPYKLAYDAAIAKLNDIKEGILQPQGWPYADTTHEETPQGDAIHWNSNPKRHNYY